MDNAESSRKSELLFESRVAASFVLRKVVPAQPSPIRLNSFSTSDEPPASLLITMLDHSNELDACSGMVESSFELELRQKKKQRCNYNYISTIEG